MVTADERAAMLGWYAPDPRMRANIGIRRRLAPLLDNSAGGIELINALLLSLPGRPFLYYGDEIGMGDNIWLEDRDAVRTPMQWNPATATPGSPVPNRDGCTSARSPHGPGPRLPSHQRGGSAAQSL